MPTDARTSVYSPRCAAALIRGIGDADLFRYNVRPISESLGGPLEISDDKPEFLRERGRPFAISFFVARRLNPFGPASCGDTMLLDSIRCY